MAWRMDESVVCGEIDNREKGRVTGRIWFMELLSKASAGVDLTEDMDEDEDEEGDEPQSRAEARADADHAYMEKLLDRVEARRESEGVDDMTDYDIIYQEERERLRREMGIPQEPEPTPEQEEENALWIAEMNAASEEALREMESKKWKEPMERKRPESVERAPELGIRLHKDVREWLPANPSSEHPMLEIVNGMHVSSAKLTARAAFCRGYAGSSQSSPQGIA